MIRHQSDRVSSPRGRESAVGHQGRLRGQQAQRDGAGPGGLQHRAGGQVRLDPPHGGVDIVVVFRVIVWPRNGDDGTNNQHWTVTHIDD